MKKKVLLVLILGIFLVSINPALADSYNVNFHQIENKVVVEHIFNLETEKEITLKIPTDAISSLSSNANYTIENSILKIKENRKNIEISYVTSEILQKVDNNYYFVNKIETNEIEKISINLILSQGFILKEGEIFPPNPKIETDGFQIIFKWSFENSKESIPMFLVIKDIREKFSYLYLMLIIIGIIIPIILIIKKRKPKIITDYKIKENEKQPKKEFEFEKYLLESEEKIIQILKNEEENQAWQKQLLIKTGFSKAKLSRTIKNLETRGLVERITIGNTNKIKLRK